MPVDCDHIGCLRSVATRFARVMVVLFFFNSHKTDLDYVGAAISWHKIFCRKILHFKQGYRFASLCINCLWHWHGNQENCSIIKPPILAPPMTACLPLFMLHLNCFVEYYTQKSHCQWWQWERKAVSNKNTKGHRSFVFLTAKYCHLAMVQELSVLHFQSHPPCVQWLH